MIHKNLVIIPARGGSKGIPKKNIKIISGKPLIVHTIEAALTANIDAKIVVSTDDQEIAEISKGAGAEIPFMRPRQLAEDSSTTIDVIKHAINSLRELQEFEPCNIILLQPTSPFREAHDIETALSIIHDRDCDSVISVTEVKEHPFIMYQINENGVLNNYIENPDFLTRRQDFPELYRINGSIYISSIKSWNRYQSFIHVPKMVPYIMRTEKSIDIDDYMDWKLAELLFEDNSFKERRG